MNVLLNNKDLFITGFRMTLLLFWGSPPVPCGSPPVPVMRAVGTAYVNIVRNSPLTLIFFFFAFGYPKLFPPGSWGSGLSYSTLAIIALGLYTGTYIAEVVRSGVNTVPAGQIEAARAIGLTFPQSMLFVIPPMMSVLIALLKNTTVAAGFSVLEAGPSAPTCQSDPSRCSPASCGSPQSLWQW